MIAGEIELHWVQKPGSRVGRVLRPVELEDALQILAARPDLRPVAGGTDLLLELDRSGQGGQSDLLDLSAIQGFDVLDGQDPDIIKVGAGVTHNTVLGSSVVPEYALPLAQACLEIGSPQLRNRATIAGNLITASPANDTISALMALNAQVGLVRWIDGQVAERYVPVQGFFSGFRSTVMQPGELVHVVRVPKLSGNQQGLWVKAGLRKAQAISVVHAGFVLDLDSDGTVVSARIALGSVAPTVVMSAGASHVLVGQALTPQVIDAAASAAADEVTPIDDGRATAEYRSDAIVTVVSRALTALAHGRERERWPGRIPLLSTRDAASRKAGASVPPGQDHNAEPLEIAVTVNGHRQQAASVFSGTLLDWLREHSGPGTKEGCAEGECGACTVVLNGDAVMSCLVPAAQADGGSVTTVEGLASASQPHPMQQSFVDKFAVQCGYCIPGFVMAAAVLAEELDSPPTRDEIELALSGNLCRCTGYYNIIDAVASAMAGSS